MWLYIHIVLKYKFDDITIRRMSLKYWDQDIWIVKSLSAILQWLIILK